MKAFLILFFVFMGTVNALATNGSGSTGNGGDGIVCRDANGEITSVELLELFEARKVLGLATVQAPSVVTPQEFRKYMSGLNGLDKKLELETRIMQVIKWFDHRLYGFNRLSWIEWGSRVVEFTSLEDVVPDIYTHDVRLIPANCKIQRFAQTLLEDKTGIVVMQFDPSIIMHLNSSELSILIFHETLQASDRFTTSTLTRQRVLYTLASDESRFRLKPFIDNAKQYLFTIPWAVFCEKHCFINH